MNATIEIRNYFEKSPPFAYSRVAVADTEHTDITPFLTEALDFIHDAREKGHHVLVHCQQGVSRSATVVLGYLIKHVGLDLRSAYVWLKQRRTVVRPKPNFLRQLKMVEKTSVIHSNSEEVLAVETTQLNLRTQQQTSEAPTAAPSSNVTGGEQGAETKSQSAASTVTVTNTALDVKDCHKETVDSGVSCNTSATTTTTTTTTTSSVDSSDNHGDHMRKRKTPESSSSSYTSSSSSSSSSPPSLTSPSPRSSPSPTPTPTFSPAPTPFGGLIPQRSALTVPTDSSTSTCAAPSSSSASASPSNEAAAAGAAGAAAGASGGCASGQAELASIKKHCSLNDGEGADVAAGGLQTPSTSSA